MIDYNPLEDALWQSFQQWKKLGRSVIRNGRAKERRLIELRNKKFKCVPVYHISQTIGESVDIDTLNSISKNIRLKPRK